MPEVSQLAQLEQLKVKDQVHLDRFSALQRLKSNKDFQEVILKHFMVEDCAQNAHNAANLALSADKRADSMAMAAAAGHFKNYLLGVERAAEQAADRAEELDDAIVQARSGEGD